MRQESEGCSYATGILEFGWKLLTILPIFYQNPKLYCRPQIYKPPPLKGLSIRIPIIIPIKGRGFINQGSTLLKDDN